MTLLQLIQQVCQELGLNYPAAVITSVDPQIVQLRALLNRHGHDLSRQFEWERLNKQYLLVTNAFTRSAVTVNGSAQVAVSTAGITTSFMLQGPGIQPFAQVVSIDSGSQLTLNMPAQMSGTSDLTFAQVAYSLPSDWLKQISQTEWDRTNRWPLIGPQSSQSWQSFQSGIVYVGPRERFRIQNNAFQVLPPPPNGLVFSFEYISNGWVLSASGVPKSSLLADTDSWVFDDSLMVAGLKLRWKQAKGLDFAFDLQEYGALLDTLKAQDKSAPVLNLSIRARSYLLDGESGVISASIGGGDAILTQDSANIVAQ